MRECVYVGDRVRKTKGDYTFEGEVVAIFNKRATSPFVPGPRRYVVEDDRGLLFIFNETQLEHVT
jgi:hypothetical protein